MTDRFAAVLFADDSADDRFLMQESWKEAGCRHPLVMVEDGEQVIAYLQGAAPHADRETHPAPALAILDVKMPRKGGLEALQWIRSEERWRTLPVLLFSASNAPSDVERAYALCANMYLVKPSTASEQVELVRAICGLWFRFAELPGGGR